jgi:hypothetical protein
MNGGLILTPPKFSDYSRERIFGAPQGVHDLVPLNRDISGFPVVYQGTENTCVSCAFTFIRQYQEKGSDLSHESLAVFQIQAQKALQFAKLVTLLVRLVSQTRKPGMRRIL